MYQTFPSTKGEIPWHYLTDHINSACPPVSLSDLQLKPSSDPELCRAACIHFALAFASHVAAEAAILRAAIPKPSASAEEWAATGVSDDALFSTLGDPTGGGANHLYDKRIGWDISQTLEVDASRITILAITEPSDPFKYLASLLYLAQHARVPLSNLLTYVYGAGKGSDDHSRFPGETLRLYLIIHLSLILRPGRIPLEGFVYKSRGGYYDFEDDFHAAFWERYVAVDFDTEACKAYLQRCLGVIVAWYAVLLEAGERDQAVGDEHVPFGKHVLVELLLRTLENIFGLEGCLHADLGTLTSPTISVSTDIPPPHLPDYSHPLTSTTFQCLPPELHLYIFSFINAGSLFDLIKVCKWLRSVCTPLLYADPLGAAYDNFLQKRKKRSGRTFKYDLTTYLIVCLPCFNYFMDSRSDLCGYLRVFHVPLVDIIRVYGRDVAFDVPSWWSLANRVTDVTLYAPLSFFPEIDLGAFADVMRRAASTVASHFPNAASITIDESWRGKSPNTSLTTPEDPASCVPWKKLSKLKFVIRCKSDNFLMCSMVLGSWSTLRNLTIHIRCELDVGAFPICPNVVNLDLSMTLMAGAMENFLGRFPGACSLRLSHWMRPAANTLAPIDFSITSPRLQHLLVGGYPIGRIPRSLETLSFEPGEPLPHCNVNGVEAIFLRNIGNPVSLLVKFAGEICTGVRFLEVTTISYLVPENELTALSHVIAEYFPHLETFVIYVRYLTNRPRRMDYPMDDGLDAMQQEYAVQFFERCPSLKTISFNGIPDASSPVGQVPGRVWTRGEGLFGDDAVMSLRGRVMLPWKLSEYWGNGSGDLHSYTS